jgi:hypothetical protein
MSVGCYSLKPLYQGPTRRRQSTRGLALGASLLAHIWFADDPLHGSTVDIEPLAHCLAALPLDGMIPCEWRICDNPVDDWHRSC